MGMMLFGFGLKDSISAIVPASNTNRFSFMMETLF